MLRRLRPGNGETIEVKVKGLGLPLLLRRSSRARRFSLQVSEARRGAHPHHAGLFELRRGR
jgi:hypothetical protein